MAAMRKFPFGARKAGFRRALPCFRRRWPLRQLCPVVQRIPGPAPWRKIGLLRRPGIAGSCGQRHLRVSNPQKIASQFAQRALGHLVDGELAGKISADAYKFHQRLDFGDFVRIQNRIRTNFSAVVVLPPAIPVDPNSSLLA
jgi:hypothetical protein